MLRLANKILLLLILACMIGCFRNESKQLDDINSLFIQNKITHNAEYKNIYKNISDSVSLYIREKLASFEMASHKTWIIDSIMCFNSNRNRFFTVILEQGKDKSDSFEYILGEKINNNWYFFLSAQTMYIPQEKYAKGTSSPLSFAKLSEIAHAELMGGYYKKNAQGVYEINDAWVNSHFENVSWCSTCKTRADFEKVHLNAVKEKWKYKIDTNEYKPLRKIKESGLSL